MKENRNYFWLELWCHQVVTLGAMLFVLSALGLFFGISITPVVFYLLSLFIPTAYAWWAWRENHLRGRALIWVELGFGIAVLLAIGSAILIFDASSDGQGYHQEAIFQLADGWLGDTSINNIYAEHYPKATEMLSAITVTATGNLETGKSWNVLFALAAFGAVFSFLQDRVAGGNRTRFLLALLIVGNPVVVSQLFTHYVDGVLYCLLLVAAVGLLRAHSGSTVWTLTGLLALIFLANVKFTGLFFAVAVVTAVFGWYLLRDRTVTWWLAAAAATALIFAVFAVGYRPYVTNFITYGSPFYPAVGGDPAENVLNNQIPASLESMNRLERLLVSLFSESANASAADNGDPSAWAAPSLKLPFVVYPRELARFAAPDVRMGGFGPLYSGALLVSLLALLLARPKFYLYYSLAVLIGSALILPDGGWWARIVPQLWLLPVVGILAAIDADRKLVKRIAWLALLLFLLNAGVVAGINSAAQLLYTQATRDQLRELGAATREAPAEIEFRIFPANAYRLEAAGVRFTAVPEVDCSAPVLLVTHARAPSRTRVCIAGDPQSVGNTPAQQLLRRLQDSAQSGSPD